MKISKFNISITIFVVLAVVLPAFAQTKQKVDKNRLANQVKNEFLHAWNGYKKYAWGHDDLKPLSKSHKDWYGQTLLMTPVDSLDTLILLGFKQEADTTRKYITENLSFDKDIDVQNFEITIRLLGGLLSAYQMTGDKKLLNLAEDLGTRLLPVFDSPTGLPYRYVNLKTGKVKGEVTNPAETGTLLIEFGTLAKLTKRAVFYDKAKRALVETYKRRSSIGLVGTNINVETGKWTNTDSHISAEIDSYYEYLLKCAILFDDADCRKMWQESIAAINKYNADEVRGELWYGHADMNTGKRTATVYGALDAFFPAVLALSGDLEHAERLQDSSFKMWRAHGIEPEEFNYQTMKVVHAGYPLRPEIVESAYYLYQYTGDEKYLRMGKTFFDDFVKYCKSEVGYASLKNVVTKEKSDKMQSFLFAETFKYYYLLFAPPKTLDFKKIVFNTEAHPIK
ncbi:MAG: glycoside hydrolase family 47 protein, partial [Pyrinomonadaceae bacterium]|nr:glycoside hydrolase family 47 protein [Pyrinomonadaceae bacterium]